MDKNHGGNLNAFSKKYEIPEEKIIDFSANINPIGLPIKTKYIIQKNIDRLIHYPDTHTGLLKHNLARFHRIKEEDLMVGNGSSELIYLIPQALKPKRVLVLKPTFSEYEIASRLAGSKVSFIGLKERDNFRVEVDKVLRAIPDFDLIFLSNPNNPTGSLISSNDILKVIKECTKYKTFFVIDEVFLDFVKESDKFQTILEAVKSRYLLILRSLTKFFAIPGLRIGYLIGNQHLINRITAFHNPWAVNSLAQAVGSQVILDKYYITKSRKFIEKEKRFLFEGLKKTDGIFPYESNANFILCKLIGRYMSVKRMIKLLAKNNIMIRDCSNFRGLDGRFFRVSVRKREDNLKLLLCLKEILSQ